MRGSVAKRLRKMARLTVGLSVIEQEKATGKRPKVLRRKLVPVWWKAPLGTFGFDQREEFTPPPQAEGLWQRFKRAIGMEQGWPDPEKFRVWMVVREMPGTLRSHYKMAKARFLRYSRAA